MPLEILEDHGDSPWTSVLKEIVALTKMNWNTADFACGEPITIADADLLWTQCIIVRILV